MSEQVVLLSVNPTVTDSLLKHIAIEYLPPKDKLYYYVTVLEQTYDPRLGIEDIAYTAINSLDQKEVEPIRYLLHKLYFEILERIRYLVPYPIDFVAVLDVGLNYVKVILTDVHDQEHI